MTAKPYSHTELRAIAETAIDLDAKIQKINRQLEPLKEELRNRAEGETFDIEGKGRVIVAKGYFIPGRSQTQLKFDQAAYELLDEKTKKKLLARGVVTEVTVQTPDRRQKPAVKIQHNK